ncbi:unnamed protein product [Cylicocyclus nassatus]|uniref:Uncharacterized protein n=1 Tax=Cylicocyclus nassatus TaxID=53992 RepID=A0AA36M9B8_CYLNA|nr:unnamed protein product [Cylicocyclus nassatus]
MRTLLVFLAILAVALAQMTFTDQWNKRSGLFEPLAPQRTSGRSASCSRHEIDEMLLQLAQVQSAQKEILADLNACAATKKTL